MLPHSLLYIQKLKKETYYTLMISSFEALHEYVTDLMKPECSPLWHSIDTANHTFKDRVACMKGYEGILKLAGYTEKDGASLRFPDAAQEPDKVKLSTLADELLMVKLEVEQMKDKGTKLSAAAIGMLMLMSLVSITNRLASN